eukprot:4893949-Prymnesium_polylepis.1
MSPRRRAAVSRIRTSLSHMPAADAVAGLDELATLFGGGSLSVKLDKVFALPDAAAAFDYTAGAGAGGVGSHL